MTDSRFCFEPIGVVHSCFKEKFGIPRQSGLAPAAEAELELLPPYDQTDALRGLETCSHIWLIFVFHQNTPGAWKPCVRPPRLGGNKRLGVYATRSPFRPNPLGLSAVELIAVKKNPTGARLMLRGIDLLDGTPVLDIKPYVPYADSIPEAQGTFAAAPPTQQLPITFSRQAIAAMEAGTAKRYAGLRQLIIQVLHHDPRPAYLDGNHDRSDFGMSLYDLNILWRIETDQILVYRITAAIHD